ncbi:MAG: RagB/SusD family nutrient uptake outer membrane protein [Paludibacter sp.]|nr:RagB/SusD family nutrient uptake outer membrane protein [Paludibacter sp.]MDD4427832.1 RagB/SusD family nutrient uptake outer membrane protein [Paludibacter sp.]
MKVMIHRKLFYILLLILSISVTSCENIFEAEDENLGTMDRVYQSPAFAEGLLLTAYIKLPSNGISFNEMATDDAVSNVKTNSFLRMATGQWSALYNPVGVWTNSLSAIFYINKFLTVIDSVEWKWTSKELNELYKIRFKGESYALRGVFQYYLLLTTGGIGSNGELLGIPLYDEFIESGSDFNVPRASFSASLERIYDDFDRALEYLTMDDYGNIANLNEVPVSLENIVTNHENYNAVFGDYSIHRISGRIVKAMKARVSILAASPAFSNGDVALWVRAANEAAVVLDKIGGVTGLDPNGHIYYLPAMVDGINMSKGVDQKEILWRSAIGLSLSLESKCFPPSLFGSGDVNPSQNLVDAFPMVNGYPISNTLSQYDPTNPYTNRDPRLSLYTVYNGSKVKGTTINTGVGGGTNAKDSILSSTRTGYYLRKFLREDVNLDPVSQASKQHYNTHMRYTELFLIYAEAANEAWGPDGKGNNNYSARDVIAGIRKRAGITQPDNYLSSITSKDDMRTLIHNERRLELCFEGFRFWDLRRWKADLTQAAKGVNINGPIYEVVNVENRMYDNSYMYYGPLPENEVLKYNALIQNKGW